MATFKGGTKLETAMRDLAKRVSNAATLQVGFLPDATYPDGTSVATVAATQEFGAPSKNIPPRPFFRNMLRDKAPNWPEAIADLLLHNDYDAEKTLQQAGAAIAGQLRQSIINLNDPPLSILTLYARKWKSEHPDGEFDLEDLGWLAKKLKSGPPDLNGVSTKPLVDTGVMLASVDFAVKK